ncbi:MAG TPA: PilN domain-containing protein, partial [Thermoleophilia bacterium]
VLGLVYVKYNSDVGAKQDELAAIQAETAVVQAKIVELSPYAALQARRTAMTETAKGIYQSSVPFSILLQELSLVIPENVRLATLTATVPPAILPGAAAAPAAAAGTADVSFSGQTEAHRDVAEFMTRLGLIPQLMNITLTSSAAAVATSTTITEGTAPTVASYTTFTVTAALRPYTTQPPTTTLQAGVAP